ncbi:outer membrane protein [Thalassotalea crassostreae]|uniref:outer membrane protein n=1 Tax=Thalassotalea crassostreae TaxID=1763536 RepID=UPI00083969CE|nr:outer membrane beta-barrel protein [Thalassotalea crassostreae]
MNKLILLCLSCFLISIPSQAKDKEEDSYELTIFVGERTSSSIEDDEDLEEDEEPFEVDFLNDASAGLILGWNYDFNRQAELLFSHSETEFDGDLVLDDMGISISYLHIGGNVLVNDGKVPIVISGGLGIAHLEPKDKELDSETRPSMNLGLGARFPVTEQLTIRLDGRVYASFFDSKGYVFCSGDSCKIRTESNVWFQGEFTLGLAYQF